MEQLRYALGLATLAVVAVAGWFVFTLLTEDEFADLYRLEVVFEDARGLRSGADVRYRGVQVGQVYDVGITDDETERASVRLVLFEGFDRLARTNSKFWIVAPRFDGLTTGATGLDTLVRDSYLAFLTPPPFGPKLAPGRIRGLERPHRDSGEGGLDPLRHGDLIMYLHAPEKHGLRVGSIVDFRGIPTGDVRAIELAEDGSHVVLTLRIHQAFRHTVTDNSKFWVARPRLSGALMSGIAIEDITALLTPFVGYQSDPDVGAPAVDGFRAIASDTRPEGAATEIVLPRVPESDSESVPSDSSVHVVDVFYEAEEVDWISSNDEIKRASSGVVFIDSSGRTVVLTPRSACDASYFERDGFGDEPEIRNEKIRVAIPGGSVLSAGLSWVDPEGRDLALLVVHDAPPDVATTSLPQMNFDADVTAPPRFDLRGAKDGVETSLEELSSLTDARGRPVVSDQRILGLVVQAGPTDTTPAFLPLHVLPVQLRPVR